MKRTFTVILAIVVTSFVMNEITGDNVKHASKIIGIELTHSEIDSMLNGLNAQKEAFEALRTEHINNELSPALVFNPLPQDFQANHEVSQVRFNLDSVCQRPDNINELAFYSVGQLSCLVRSRQVSSYELTTFFIERMKRFDSLLHCVITLTENLALEQARRADAEIAAGRYRGPLHGIPYGAKDLLAKKGYKTTWGAMPYKDQVLDYDAAVIQKLEDSGAVLVAKLSLGALAWGDVWYGAKTRNPWNIDEGSSGSSAGSASAVAAGLVPFAIGTETLGSIVSPSTVCGVTGLRPTFGAVSRYGAMALSWSMDKIGPICRNADDCAIVFNAIRGVDKRDPGTIAHTFHYGVKDKKKNMRIGYLKSVFEQDYGFRKTDSITLARLEAAGIDLIPVELPSSKNLRFILTAEAAAAFDDLTRSGQDDLMVRQIQNAWPNVFREARFIPAVEYIQANRLRFQLIEDMARVFDKVDLYITPSWRGSNLFITNLTGHPQVVVPNGFSEEGTPVSISFVGQLFEEGPLLEFAGAFQRLTDHHKQHPEMFVD